MSADENYLQSFFVSIFLGCCGCCSALRPRYKRLVDNIFPVNPDDGLVKSNMEKLTFYSLVRKFQGFVSGIDFFYH